MESDLPAQLASGAIAELQNIVGRLLGPASTELGGLVGDQVKAWRAARALKLLRKVEGKIEEAGYHNVCVSPKFLTPWIDAASLESDDDLCERWANLLAHAADPDGEDETVGYITVLRELAPRDASLLDAVYSETVNGLLSRSNIASPSEHYRKPMIFKREELQKVYWKAGLSDRELPQRDEALTDPDEQSEFYVASVGNLKRLGLIDEVATYGGHAYAISQFGWRFVQACTPHDYELPGPLL